MNKTATHYSQSNNGPGACGAGNGRKVGRRVIVTSTHEQVTCKSCLKFLNTPPWTAPKPTTWEPTMCHHRVITRRGFQRTTILCYEQGTHELVGENGAVAPILTAEGPQPFRFCDRHIRYQLQGYPSTVTARKVG